VIRESIEIGRPPADVFAYLDQLERHTEWQGNLVDAKVQTEGPPRVGTRVLETRRVPGGPRDFTYEVTEHDPPRRVAFRVVDGPVRPVGTVTVEPVDDGSRSRVTLELDFEGHGLGKLFAPMARRSAAKTVPQDQARLKQRLEAGA
jgi:uncharacterized protein YndB with AHSA1/START domain